MKHSILVLLVLLFSCQRNGNHKAVENQPKTVFLSSTNNAFSSYLLNFKKISLPIVIKGCKIKESDFTYFDPKKFTQFTEDFLAYGQIPTNGKYIATLTLGAADCYLPILTTYDLSGKKIAQETIAIGGCGSDCGFTCEEFMTLKKDLSFYTSDTISTYDCDSLGNETPGTYEYYVIFRKGKLLSNGKIEISKEIKSKLKGRYKN